VNINVSLCNLDPKSICSCSKIICMNVKWKQLYTCMFVLFRCLQSLIDKTQIFATCAKTQVECQICCMFRAPNFLFFVAETYMLIFA
jgi:hypothetical protein